MLISKLSFIFYVLFPVHICVDFTTVVY